VGYPLRFCLDPSIVPVAGLKPANLVSPASYLCTEAQISWNLTTPFDLSREVFERTWMLSETALVTVLYGLAPTPGPDNQGPGNTMLVYTIPI